MKKDKKDKRGQTERKPKSWQGCMTCRAARTKCTEERPICSRCKTKGLECQYDINDRFRVFEFETKNAKVVKHSTRRLNTGDAESSTSRPQIETSIDLLSTESSTRATTPEPFHSSDLETVERRGSESPILKTPIWTEMQTDELDIPYLHFFVMNMGNVITYAEWFPKVVTEIFSRIPESAVLRHSVLAVTSLHVDNALHRPLVRGLTHKQHAIAALQRALSTGQITEDVAISIFLIFWLDIFEGRVIPQSHLRGFYLVLEKLQESWTKGDATKLSPLLLVIKRIMIRFDCVVATVHGAPPIFPLCDEAEIFRSKPYLTNLAQDLNTLDWAIVCFALDDLFHLSSHVIRGAVAARNTPEYLNDAIFRHSTELLLARNLVMLREKHAKWLDLPTCKIAFQREHLAQSNPVFATLPAKQFLDYPPLRIHDRTFNILLMEWHAMSLFISIAPPESERRKPSQEDLQNAVEIVRIHVGLNLDPLERAFVPAFFQVLVAANAFAGGGKLYHRELRWVYQRVEEMAQRKTYPLERVAPFVQRLRMWQDRLHSMITIEELMST